MEKLDQLRHVMAENRLRDDAEVLADLCRADAPNAQQRDRAVSGAIDLIHSIRDNNRPALMEMFLTEYGLSTDEGIALMCLAEALLRVPDADTMDALIEDKIAPSSWGVHLGKSSSAMVNASTWALMLTGKFLQDEQGVAATLKGAVKRLGEPIIRVAVGRVMRLLGAQFVLGQTIGDAVANGEKSRSHGYTYSYDMLGEAALTAKDADDFFTAYSAAIGYLARHCRSNSVRENPGVSIKLSALHPRYEMGQRDRIMDELVQSTRRLARQAKAANMGLNIDAEEADRLDLSLDVVEAVLRDPQLDGWDGFGVVVQAYGKRAAYVLDWLYSLAQKLDRRIMVRLVKGAYWDTEIKRAQVDGLSGFPVFSHKAATDVSYICCAKKLLTMTDRIYPQFATHNAHSVATILELATDRSLFEFQRLHGMGEALHDQVLAEQDLRCRIYAPVGSHRDLLAYLVRRLLENGANSSFVNQIVDASVPAEVIAADPFEHLKPTRVPVVLPRDLYAPERANSKGWDLTDRLDIESLSAARENFKTHRWSVGPLIAGGREGGQMHDVRNPADPEDVVGTVRFCSSADVEHAIAAAQPWDVPASARAKILNKAAELYEAKFGELFAVLTREAGKTPRDAIAELREAVDFLRYYAARGQELRDPARGVFACISPWNFPLAIFTGQIAAALAAGNGVLAKPAEATPTIAGLAVDLLHRAGVPAECLQMLPGTGAKVGARLCSDPRIDGVCFTGSTATAQIINRAMADNLHPAAPLIAETGGLNAMIVDSTALPEQAIRDIVISAFQSAGQRCSALRMLYVQEDVKETFLDMLFGAMDELCVANPWAFKTDLGPVIDGAAKQEIQSYIDAGEADGRVLKQVAVQDLGGNFIAPTAIRVAGIGELEREVFGPVLHIATFGADELDDVVDAINNSGYGLTFGMHSRIDDRIEQVTSRVRAGNIYINRNQIGAIVGSQPFGGEGLSGTGPKAGGPAYVARFTQPDHKKIGAVGGHAADTAAVQHLLGQTKPDTAMLNSFALPGPTGESNRLSEFGRGTVLCLGPTASAALEQAEIARSNGCAAVCVAPGLLGTQGVDGVLPAAALGQLAGVDAVASFAPATELRALRQALAARPGKLIPLLCEADMDLRCRLERHVCVDTTAAGGNASLLSAAS